MQPIGHLLCYFLPIFTFNNNPFKTRNPMSLSSKIPAYLILFSFLAFSGCKPRLVSNGNSDTESTKDSTTTVNAGKPSRDNPVMPDAITAKYKEDAARLAVKEMLSKTRPPAKDCYVDPDRIQNYYEWLSLLASLLAKFVS